MKKTIRALVIAGVVLISLYTITQPVKAYPHTADGEGFPLASQLTITSPSENSVNNPKSLVLDISFQLMLSLKHATVTYTIDGRNKTTIPLTATQQTIQGKRTYANGTTVTITTSPFAPVIVTGTIKLPELSEGTHILTVNSEYDANGKVGLDNATVKFTVKNDLSQQIPEFPVWTLLAVTAAALVAVIGVYRRRLTTSNGETSQ